MENNNKKEHIIIKIFKNEKIRSLIFLGFWAIFIGYLIVVLVIPYEKGLANQVSDSTGNVVENNEVDNGNVSFEDMQKSLLKYNFNYRYTVNYLGEKVIYKGVMFGNETIGYKETISGIEKYYIKGMEIYKDVLGEKTLVSDKTTNVYGGYLSVDYIMDLIQEVEYTNMENVYNFQINDVYVKIEAGVDNISSIEITENNNSYLLEFSSVNEITALDY